MSDTRAQITICGLGPGAVGDVTDRTRQVLADASRVFLRTRRHPSATLAPNADTFDHIYDGAEHLDTVYTDIADALVEAALENEGVVYAVPGSPLVLERSVRHLRRDPRIDVELVPALSFLDTTWARLGIDPVEEAVRLIDGHTFARDAAGERGPLLVAHAHAAWVLSDIKLAIDAGSEQSVLVLQRLGTSDESITEVAWPDLDRVVEADHLTSLYLPEVTAPVARELHQSVELVHRLRQECPWDQEQTHRSLRKYLVEESYEVLDAIDQLDGPGVSDASSVYADLEEELGDLLFQVLFHAELAAEAGEFTIADVARTMHDKLVGRHPHVFGDVVASDATAVVANWEAIKKTEKQRASIMDGIPSSLPALLLTEKVLKKADRSGQTADADWISEVMSRPFDPTSESSIGQHLLAVVELARRNELDPEAALRQVTAAARQRFEAAETAGIDDQLWVAG